MNQEDVLIDIQCPVCQERFAIFDLFFHIHQQHEAFLAVWTALTNPAAADAFIDDFDDSYEGLSDLCEQIGNHTVSTDPNSVSEIVDKNNAERCPICLETNAVAHRSLRVCNHTFCSDCISRWLTTSKLCPVCKTDVTTDKM